MSLFVDAAGSLSFGWNFRWEGRDAKGRPLVEVLLRDGDAGKCEVT